MKFELSQAIEVLERTPAVVSALLSGISDAWTTADEGDGTFSPRDVVGHLLSGEETDWVPRAELILAHGESRPFEPFDRFAFRDDYRTRSLPELLKDFTDARAKNLARIREMPLDESKLDLTGRHPELGVVTLRQLLATWVAHDLSHLRQIARVMAKQYREEVGPWTRFHRVFEE